MVIIFGAPTPQGVVMQRNLSLPLAKTIAEATLAECKAKGFSTSAAVVDRSGQLMVLLRDEQAGPQTAEMARRKRTPPVCFGSRRRNFRSAPWRIQDRPHSGTSPIFSLSVVEYPSKLATTRSVELEARAPRLKPTMRAQKPGLPRWQTS